LLCLSGIVEAIPGTAKERPTAKSSSEERDQNSHWVSPIFVCPHTWEHGLLFATSLCVCVCLRLTVSVCACVLLYSTRPSFRGSASTVRKENVTLVPFIWDLDGDEDASEPSKVRTPAQTITFLPQLPVLDVLIYGANVFFSVNIENGAEWKDDKKQGAVVAGSMSFRLGLVHKNGNFDSSFAPWTTTEQAITI